MGARVACRSDVKIATWNVNSLRARLPRVLELLAQHRPDVLLMQETKVLPDAFPEDELAVAGYRAVHHSAGRWAGVAIAAHEGLELADPVRGLPGEPVAEEARWLEATIDGTRFASTYVPNGRAVDHPAFTEKLAFLDAAVGRVAALAPAGPLVLGGDFNVAPADLDVYDPAAFAGSTHVTPPERARIDALLAAGTVDAYRVLHPDDAGFTWWDYRQGHFHRRMGMRIDLLLVSAALAPRVRACGIDRNYRKGPKPSDHAPLLLEVE